MKGRSICPEPWNQLQPHVLGVYSSCAEIEPLTGTFFWDNTTAQSLPRTPIDMIFAAVMALNAYSI
jgi:hypothetical protein